LSLSEMMTIVVFFHWSRYRDFKTYYTTYVMQHLTAEFPDLLSYNRFVELMPRIIVPLCAYLNQRKAESTGIAFIDSTSLSVCNNRRIGQHKVFQGVAARGKTSMGWFFGFNGLILSPIHLVINDQGELLNVCLTPGNVHDQLPVSQLCQGLVGKLFGDKGYINKKLTEALGEQGLILITRLRKNMKNHLMPLIDKILLRKRALIETVIDQLKNISQIEHSRHRSYAGFAVNLLAGLVAYTFRPTKPSLNLQAEFGQNMLVLA